MPIARLRPPRRRTVSFSSDRGVAAYELMIRMLPIGYRMSVRSERRLCEEVHLNLAYRWFSRLSLDGDLPDHSTFSKNRHGRFRQSDLLRELFESVVRRCMAEGLVGGEGFAVEKYLAVLDDAAFGAAAPVTPKYISLSDPASRWTAAQAGPASFAYCTNYLIDLDHAVIVDVEPQGCDVVSDVMLRELVRQLCRLELKAHGQSTAGLIASGPQDAGNGGVLDEHAWDA